MPSFILTAFILVFISLNPAQAVVSTNDEPSGGGGIYGKLTEGEELVKAKRFQEAVHLLEKADSAPEWNLWKNTLLAEAYLALNAANKASALLTELPSEPDAALNLNQDFYRRLYRRALIAKKGAMVKLGQDTKNVSNRLWALFPDMEATASVSPTAQDKADWLHVMVAKQKYEAIFGTISISDLSGLPGSKKCEAMFELGHGLRNFKKFDNAYPAFSAGVSDECPDEFLSKNLYWQAKLAARGKDQEAALASYRKFIEKFPDHRLTDDAYYAIHKIYKGLKQDAKANEAYKKLIAYGRGDMRAKILFEDGFEDYRKGRYKNALENFEVIVSGRPGEDESYPQALYWKAKTFEKLKGKEKAKALYQTLLSDFPLSFYTVLAAHQLGTKPNLPDLTPPSVSVPGDVFSQELFSAVDDLNRHGKKEAAQALVDYYSRLRPASSQVFIAKKWLETGDYNQVIRMGFDHFGVGPSEGVGRKSDPMLFTLYPLAYKKQMATGAGQFGIAKGMIAGIMREESLFQGKVTSWAGAVGLMQLMPGTAAEMSRKYGISYSPSLLTDPQTNILLGSSYLDRMADNYNSIPMAIMAYNAGPGNVNKWRASMGTLPLDEFIEQVPFDETRGYVKRVMRSMQVYGLMMDEGLFKEKFFSMKVK